MTTKRSFFVIIFAALCVLSGCGGRKQQEEERSDNLGAKPRAFKTKKKHIAKLIGGGLRPPLF